MAWLDDLVRVDVDLRVKKAVEDRIELMMLEAEKLCGERNRYYHSPQVDFFDLDIPQVAIWHDSGDILIMLRSAVGNNYEEACTECAHELIHCIAPAPSDSLVPCMGDETSTVLEEGIATRFQQYIHDDWLKVKPKFTFPPSFRHYELAASFVNELLQHCPVAIPMLRHSVKGLRLIDSNTIETIIPDLPQGLALNLGKCLSVLKAEIAQNTESLR